LEARIDPRTIDMLLERTRNLASAFVVVLSLAAVASAETVRLRDGRMIAGEVRVEGRTVVVDATFPKVATFTLRRDEIAPESLFAVLERRADPNDVAQRRELADLAERSGLEALAIAEYRTIQRLEPGSAKELEPRIARLYDAIANDLLEEARDLLEVDDRESALMYLHTIVEDHPETKAATEAKRMIRDMQRTVAEAAAVATKTVPESEAPKLLDRVTESLNEGDEKLEGIRGFASASVKHQRAAERAIRHYERAWESAKQLPVSADTPELRGRITATRERAKSRLIDAYLTAASIHVQRRSLTSAERYCNEAYVLDPENAATHDLHRLIVQAKIFNGSGVLVE
jgi:tetratricopeptide (TPR) repeat protein